MNEKHGDWKIGAETIESLSTLTVIWSYCTLCWFVKRSTHQSQQSRACVGGIVVRGHVCDFKSMIVGSRICPIFSPLQAECCRPTELVSTLVISRRQSDYYRLLLNLPVNGSNLKTELSSFHYRFVTILHACGAGDNIFFLCQTWYDSAGGPSPREGTLQRLLIKKIDMLTLTPTNQLVLYFPLLKRHLPYRS